MEFEDSLKKQQQKSCLRKEKVGRREREHEGDGGKGRETGREQAVNSHLF